MRVLHVYKDYFPVLGGIENHLRTVVQELAKGPGIEPAVLVTSPDARTRRSFDGPVPVTFAGRIATVASTPLSPALLGELARDPADIIHLHFPYPVGEAAYLLAGRHRPLVITYHSDVVRQQRILRFYRPILWRVLRRADRLLATSPQYARSSPYLRRFAGKTEIVPLGVALNLFRPPASEQARSAEPTILFVGRFRYYKGLTILLDALRLVPEGRLILCGSGPAEPDLRARAADPDLAGRVTFTGAVPEEELIRLYRQAWVFVLPAVERSEAFGQVLIEAMASGLPVISTELGTGTSFVNQAGQTGLIVPPRDPVALAEALRTLLADAPLRRRFGAAGRCRAEAEFTLDAMIDRLIWIYEQVATDRVSGERRRWPPWARHRLK